MALNCAVLVMLVFVPVMRASVSFPIVIQVDLLGDEVDTLLSVLGKIYIALDHYSPVLKHYPGVRKVLHYKAMSLAIEILQDI